MKYLISIIVLMSSVHAQFVTISNDPAAVHRWAFWDFNKGTLYEWAMADTTVKKAPALLINSYKLEKMNDTSVGGSQFKFFLSDLTIISIIYDHSIPVYIEVGSIFNENHDNDDLFIILSGPGYNRSFPGDYFSPLPYDSTSIFKND